MTAIRPAAVAGSFYPDDPAQLSAAIAGLLDDAPPPPPGPPPKAVIAPHAGLIYSGPVAAAVYRRLAPLRGRVERVVLFGPAHRVPVAGLALSGADAFATPGGALAVDAAWSARLAGRPGVITDDRAHAWEHSLEIHLPFLRAVLGPTVRVVPVVVGGASPALVADALETLWGGPETVIVISSDLSHYHPYTVCQDLDGATTRAIEALDPAAIDGEQACGRLPIAGLLSVARRRGLRVETVAVCNSGDTAGPRDRVVGYGAWAFYEPAAEGTGGEADADPLAGLVAAHGTDLLRLAADAIRHGLVHQHQPPPVDDAALPPALRGQGACFVTLTHGPDKALRGCIGSPLAWRGLVADLVDNACKAAFADPRFAPLTAAELPDLALSVSLLSPPEPLAFTGQADLIARLRPGVDGLILEDRVNGRPHRGLFLPSVWEQLPQPGVFLAHLKRKAGLPPDHWSPTVRVQRFSTHAVSSRTLPDPAALWRTDG